MDIRNIGIVAHVDAGKTTTTEQLLFQSGQIRSLGRVDDGTAHTDSLDVERERGISVRAAVTRFEWKGCQINLIDTPGHVDFASEVERSLRVLDGAVLVVSAVDGVQAHTETLWQALTTARIPTLIYVNKVDRVGVDLSALIQDLATTLHKEVLPLQAVDGSGIDFHKINSLFSNGAETDAEALHRHPRFDSAYAKLAEHDECLMEAYIEGRTPTPNELWRELVRQVRVAQVFPILFGSSLKGIGITPLLDGIVDFLPSPRGSVDDPLSGLVFKVDRDPVRGRATYVRLFGGALENRDAVHNATRNVDEKVTQIRKIDVQSFSDSGVLTCGDVGALYGLSQARVGDVLGVPGPIPNVPPLSVPLLTVQVIPETDANLFPLVDAMRELEDEDPALSCQWLPEERELHIQVMGKIQLEVLTREISRRFGLSVTFGPPSVIYKETPATKGEGFVAYTMPKPCWAILRFAIEPGPRGSGLVYSAHVRTEDLLQSYQNEVARRVPEALEQGLYGWEVTDLKVALMEGQHHVWHTHPLDFVVATPMGIMDGLHRVGTNLLEPYLSFRASVPEDFGGRILSDLAQMRAEFDNPSSASGRFTVEGVLPVSTSMEYPVQLAMLTGGRGVFATRFLDYRIAPPDVKASRKRRGVNPLDTSRYILAVRSALSAL